MTQAGFLVTAFPKARVLHMVRDGRAISHSLVSRNLEFPPFSNTDHAQNLKQWASLASGYSRHSIITHLLIDLYSGCSKCVT